MFPQSANPFLVGYHVRTEETADPVSGEVRVKVREQDGFVSSLLFLVTLLSLGVGLSFAHWSTLRTQTVYVQRQVVEGLLIIYMLAAMAFMLRLRFSRRPTVRALYRLSGQEASGLRGKLREKLPLIGLAVFYVPGTLNDFPRIFAHIGCMSCFIDCDLQLDYIVSTAFHITRLLFMGTELLFCMYFKNKILHQNWKIRYGLSIVMVATGTVLFDCVLHDSKDVFGITTSSRNTCRGQDVAQLDHHTQNCLKENTTLYTASNTVDPFFYPLNIEFFLLVLEVVVHLFHTLQYIVKNDEMKPAAIPLGDFQDKLRLGRQRMLQHKAEMDRVMAIQGGQSAEGKAVSAQKIKQEKLRLGRLCDELADVVQYYNAGDVIRFRKTLHQTKQTPGSAHASPKQRRHYGATGLHDDGVAMVPPAGAGTSGSGLAPRPSRFNCIVLLCVLWNLLLIALGLLTHIDKSETFNFVYLVCESIYYIPLLLTCAVGCHYSARLTPRTRAFHGLEAMVVLATMGAFSWIFFAMIASAAALRSGAHPGGYPAEPWLSVVRHISYLLQLYLQTCLMFQAARLEVKDATVGSSRFRATLLPLSIFNITLWFVNSFVALNNIRDLNWDQIHYYRKHHWGLIMHCTVPLALFYRFNSAVFFLETFLDNRI